jgi:uracil-DNA glycosylase
MNLARRIRCEEFPCKDVNHAGFIVPSIALEPKYITIVLISEAAPQDRRDYYHAAGEPLFARTTVQAFRDAGADVDSMKDIIRLGVYLTTAVKCAKKAYGVSAGTIEECSHLLEKEIAIFPDVRAYLLMGDVAIRALNQIARRSGEPRVIPAGSTYKVRGGEFSFRGARAFPSYLQAGPSFFIEKSKRKMIAQDIAAALALLS